MRFRAATEHDVEAVAALHADSWRRTYRGAYSDAFLDGDVFADRLTVWSARLAQPSNDHFTIVADDGDSIVGFAHTILDQHPELGALLENLHVSSAEKGRGVGTRLMGESARELAARRLGSGLFLTVLEQNTAAQAFYDARGGARVARRIGGPFPGGGTAPVFVYAWSTPAQLLGRD